MSIRLPRLNEECGIFGIYAPQDQNDVSRLVYYGLIALQHRGQQSCGIAANSERETTYHKDVGLVNDVFNDGILQKLKGNMAIGHVRYSRSGDGLYARENAQPLVLRYAKYKFAIAYNGKLLNGNELRDEYEQQGAVFQTTSDSEVIAQTIARERVRCGSVEEAVSRSLKKLKGAYSLIVMSPQKIIAAKDPWGFRPLCMGIIKGESGSAYVFASETCALDSVGADFVRELEPGEVVRVMNGEVKTLRDNCGGPSNLCIFEQIYFARPDSSIYGQLLSDSRRLAGRLLARNHPVEADLVTDIPDSGTPAAVGYAAESGIPYVEAFIKNRYIARTFITSGQQARHLAVRLKVNPIRKYVAGKRVIMVDDSIVRGTSVRHIVQAMRDAGAKEVHLRIASPPFLWPCYFGTDINSRKDLIAVNYTLEETRQQIGADTLCYMNLEQLAQVMPDCTNPGYCDGCLTGKYPIEPVEPGSSVVYD